MTAAPPLRQAVARQGEPADESFKHGDQAMIERLRKILNKHFSEDGYGRSWADAAVARFAELSENAMSIRRALDSVSDGQKLALQQMQFAQTVVNQLKRSVEELQRENGRSLPAPGDSNVDLKGE